MQDFTASALDYLELGLVPNVALAHQYLDKLISPATPLYGTVAFPDLLTQVIEDKTWATGAREIVIPLTGGLDSRGILGAALRIFSTDAIHCVTIGAADNPDLAVARRVCQQLSVSHTTIHPDQFRWDIDHALSEGRNIHRNSGGCPPIDGLLMYGTLAAALAPGLPVLSGYLGDALTGAHVPCPHDTTDPIDFFIRRNSEVFAAAIGTDHMKLLLAGLLEDCQTTMAGFDGATHHDCLDLALRQRMRIRAITVHQVPNTIAVYEDPRLVGYWMSAPLEKRRDQTLYRADLHSAFPRVFTTKPRNLIKKTKSAIGRHLPMNVRAVIARLTRPARPARFDPAERGDPSTNKAMLRVLVELTDAFDARRILPRSFGADARKLTAAPTRQQWNNVRWVASAELYLRTGALR